MAAEKIDALELNIESKLSVENLDKLIESLRKLGKEVDNVKNKKPKEAVKAVGNGANEAANGIDNFLGKTVRVAAVIALFSKAADTISDCVSESLTYNKTLNMFTVSLGEYATNATRYGETVRDALGIDIAGWQKAQGIFQTLITGFGVTGDQAAYMSQNLTQLSYDIASFYNITNEEAQNKLKSAIAGRLEPIRKLGWDLSQTKLVDIAKNPNYYGQQTFAINEQTGAIEANTTAVDDNTKHKIVNFNQLTQQEKVQLRYIALMTQVTQVQGAYAKALSDPANQMKVFKEQLSMTSRELGNVFIPAINMALPYLTAFTQLAGEAFRALASLFGYEIPDMSDRMDISSVAEPYNDVVQATGRAAGNAKKMKDYMLGIDELNVFNPNTGAGGGGGGVGGQNSNLNNLLTPGYDFLSKAVKSSIEQAKKEIQGFLNDLKKRPVSLPLEILFTGATELGENFWTAVIGKTPEELAQEAYNNGTTVEWEFYRGIAWAAANAAEKPFELLFGSPEEIGAKAAEAGRTIGEQILLEIGKKALDLTNNPLLKPLYELVHGKGSLDRDIQAYNNMMNSRNHVGETSSSHYVVGNGNGRGKGTTVEAPVLSLGNTAADEARKAGERVSKSYAEGITSNFSLVKTETDKVFKASLNGISGGGSQGAQKFYNTSANEAYKYAMGLTSSKSKSEAYVAGATLANQGVKGSTTYNNNKNGFGYAGQMSGAGYVGGVDKYKDKAKTSGATIAKNALNKLKEILGIHSPSTAFGEAGMNSVLGYANYMEKYSYLAENAAKDMANASLNAVETANAYTTSNAGYGIAASNQGALADFLSGMYNAFASAMTGTNAKGDTIVMIDGKEVFRAVQRQERNNGIAIGNGAFA